MVRGCYVIIFCSLRCFFISFFRSSLSLSCCPAILRWKWGDPARGEGGPVCVLLAYSFVFFILLRLLAGSFFHFLILSSPLAFLLLHCRRCGVHCYCGFRSLLSPSPFGEGEGRNNTEKEKKKKRKKKMTNKRTRGNRKEGKASNERKRMKYYLVLSNHDR